MSTRAPAAHPASRPPFADPVIVIAALWMLFWGWVAVALRPIGDFGVETDFYGDFAVYARDWAAGQPTLMNGFRGPFYYVLLAGFGKLGLDLFSVAKFLSLVSAGACLILTGQLLRKLWNSEAAIVGVLLMASSLTFIDYSYRACNDLVFLALATGALRLLFVDEERLMKGWAVAGVLAGAAWMTRYNGSVLLPAALITAPLLYGRSRRTLLAIGVFLAGWFLIAAPWLAFVAGAAGTPFWNKAYENIAIEVLTEDPNRAQITGFMAASDVRSVGDIWNVAPARFLRVMAGNVGDHLLFDARRLVGIPWAVVAAVGLVLGFPGWRNRKAVAFAAVAVLTYVSLLPIFYNERFMLPLLPFWAAAAGGVAWWLSRPPAAQSASGRAAPASGAQSARGRSATTSGARPLKGRTVAAPARSKIMGLFGALALLAAYNQVEGYRLATDPARFGGVPVEYLDLVRNVRASGVAIGPGTPIAARKPHLSWFFDAPTVGVPTGSLETLRASGAHFLLVSGAEVNVFPSLASIWAPRSAAEIPVGLTMVGVGNTRRSDGQRMRATLYSVADPLPYERRASSPFKAAAEPPEGMARVDFLRWQLVRWTLRSGARNDPDEFLRAMSPGGREHRETLPLRAWLSLRDGDIRGAEDAYRRLLAVDPGGTTAALGLATCAALDRRPADQRKWLETVFGPSGVGGWPETENLHAEVRRQMTEQNWAEALGVASAAVESDPGLRWARVAMAYALHALFRPAEAMVQVRAVLELAPNDPEALALVTTLEADLKSLEGLGR